MKFEWKQSDGEQKLGITELPGHQRSAELKMFFISNQAESKQEKKKIREDFFLSI